jgi:hypothetical protein
LRKNHGGSDSDQEQTESDDIFFHVMGITALP